MVVAFDLRRGPKYQARVPLSLPSGTANKPGSDFACDRVARVVGARACVAATTMTERKTTEAECRRLAAHFFELAKSSRTESERALSLAMAQEWLDLAERMSQRSRLRVG